MSEDYHAVLGIQSGASHTEILHAYTELVKKLHPDQNRDDPSAEERFFRIQRAFEMLYEPERHQLVAAFHTDLSAFLRVHCLRDSIRRSANFQDPYLALIGMATVFYLFLLAAIFFIAPASGSDPSGPATAMEPAMTMDSLRITLMAGMTLVYVSVVGFALYRRPRQ